MKKRYLWYQECGKYKERWTNEWMNKWKRKINSGQVTKIIVFLCPKMWFFSYLLQSCSSLTPTTILHTATVTTATTGPSRLLMPPTATPALHNSHHQQYRYWHYHHQPYHSTCYCPHENLWPSLSTAPGSLVDKETWVIVLLLLIH